MLLFVANGMQHSRHLSCSGTKNDPHPGSKDGIKVEKFENNLMMYMLYLDGRLDIIKSAENAK